MSHRPMPTLAECVEALEKGNRATILVVGDERLHEWFRDDDDFEGKPWSHVSSIHRITAKRLHTSEEVAEVYLAHKPSHNRTPILLIDRLETVAVLPKREEP